VAWTDLTQDRDKRRALVIMEMNLQVPQDARNLLTLPQIEEPPQNSGRRKGDMKQVTY
jgi:hypothetical protein